jgi:hypothetical protein
MKRAHIMLIIPLAVFLCGCVAKLRMTVETRDGQGSVIERADVTNTDTNGRTFKASGDGTIGLTALAEDSDGLQALRFEGGFSCNRSSGGIGTVQQGTYLINDPNLPGQHPTSESFSNQFAVQCSARNLFGHHSRLRHGCKKRLHLHQRCDSACAITYGRFERGRDRLKVQVSAKWGGETPCSAETSCRHQPRKGFIHKTVRAE